MSSYKKGRKCITLNNLGASYIESEDYVNAIVVLSKALRKIQKVSPTIEKILETERNNVQENTGKEDDNMFHLDSWMSDTNILNRQCYNSNNNKMIDLDTSSSKISFQSISRRTIVIPSAVKDCKSRMIPVAIIFNLALAYHLYGMEKENDMEILEAAVELYDMVLDYYLTTNTPQSTCLIFLMSCLNNLGQLHRQLDDEEFSEYFYKKLVLLLMCIVDHYPSDERPCDLDEFFQNTMHLMLPNYSVMAAAA